MKRMVFEKIDINGWKRREYFEHYFTNISSEPANSQRINTDHYDNK